MSCVKEKYFTIISAAFLFSVFVRFSIKDREVIKASEIHDIQNINFQFFGVFKENEIPGEEQVKAILDDSRYILEVTPTGKLRLIGQNICQQVKVNKCIKGEQPSGDIIWILSGNGFWYKEETDTIYNWGKTNIMSDNNSYIVILNALAYKNTVYYYNEFLPGALMVSREEQHSYTDVTRKYNYSQLEQFEFFAENESALSKMYNLKNYVFSYLNSNYNYQK